MSDAMSKLREWLEEEAEELMKQAMGRRGYAECEEISSTDKKIAHKIAEQMTGRKLPHTTAAEDRRNASIQRKIAEKCECESRQLSQWADMLRQLEALLPALEHGNEPHDDEEFVQQELARAQQTPKWRDPSDSELNNPLWNAIWEAIKSWDIKTPRDSGYHGATGTEVSRIYDVVARAQGGELQARLEEARMSPHEGKCGCLRRGSGIECDCARGKRIAKLERLAEVGKQPHPFDTFGDV